MNKFLISNIIIVILIVSILLLKLQANAKIIIIAIIALCYILLLVYASANIQFNFFIKSFNKNIFHKNKVAISFDDGPHKDNIPIILNILKKYNAKANFFIVGSKAEKNEDLIRDIFNEKHFIANHSYYHSNLFPFKSVKKIKYEITKTNDIIFRLTNVNNKYFRPPFGVTNPNIARAIKQLNMTSIGWSIRSFDTNTKKAEVVVNRIIKNIKGGDIILLHDTNKNIAEILEKILIYLEQNNINCVSIEELLKQK